MTFTPRRVIHTCRLSLPIPIPNIPKHTLLSFVFFFNRKNNKKYLNGLFGDKEKKAKRKKKEKEKERKEEQRKWAKYHQEQP